jgi:fibro-slime domain-containing protein
MRIYSTVLLSLLSLGALSLAACDSSSGNPADGGTGGDDVDSSVPLDGDGSIITPQCGQLIAELRDFKADHPDFENGNQDDRGLVEDDLGADGLPVYKPSGATPTVSGAASFDQWYRDVAGVNMTFLVPLTLLETPAGSGVYVYDDPDFFPLDGKGWPGEEVMGHNFHFTTHIHGTFLYRGGENFAFRGDDDVWVFVNGKLALDLGGVHGVEEGAIDFDAKAGQLGISTGNVYTLDVFHAERHTSASNFRVETSIDCLVVE